MKEDMWAYQYYSLVEQTSSSIDNYLINTTAPKGMEVYAIMTYNAGTPTTDEASNEFYRETKLGLANRIAGGNLTSQTIWCKMTNCSLSFPVNNPVWTVNALMSLGV